METIAQAPKYNLNEEQEKKLILREYRSLLRALKAKLKPGDKDLIRIAFEMSAEATHKTMRRKQRGAIYPASAGRGQDKTSKRSAWVSVLLSAHYCTTRWKTPMLRSKM